MSKTHPARENSDVCDFLSPHPEKVEALRDELPDLRGAAALFKLLASRRRIQIIYLLAREELCVCDLAALLQTSVSNASHHLRALRKADLVNYRRVGRHSLYRLTEASLVDILNLCMKFEDGHSFK